MAQATMEKRSTSAPDAGKNKVNISLPRKKTAPEKRTLNLVIKEKKSIDPMKWIPGVIVVLILAALFGKFAVYDRYAALEDAENELASQKQQLQDTLDAMSDFNEVQENYNKYSYTGYDRTIADRLDVLDLLERQVFPVCEVQSMAISGKTINMSLTDLNLSQVSQLIASLEAEPLVSNVYVSTASHDNDQEIGSATMSVELVDATTLEGGAENE